MVNRRTYSFDDETVKVLENESKKLHVSKSALLRLLIWNYHNSKGGKTEIAE